MANEYGIDHEINHIERCFDAFVVSEVEREIQYHKGKIKYSAECLEKLEQQLKNNKLGWRRRILIMANEYGIDHEINHIERCFDAFVVSEVEREIQYHKGKIKYSAECLEKLEQQLKNNKLEGD